MNSKKKSWVPSAFSSQLSSISLPCEEAPERRKSTEPVEYKEVKQKTETANSNWIDQYAPKSSAEIAVHPKKLEELGKWLKFCGTVRNKHGAPICLISGPAGSGKTAALRVLAEESQYEIQEYTNPVDREQIIKLGDQINGASYFGSRLDDFRVFLRKASRFKPIFGKYKKRLLLVEDLPNALLSDVAALEAILEEYSQHGMAPLVFIAADSKGRTLNISHNLFSDKMKQKFRIMHINFNPVATTLLQKAMKRFRLLLSQQQDTAYNEPPPDIIESIVVSAQGDIRNALINFHFASLTTTHGALETVAVPSEKNTAKRKKQRALKSVGCDQTLTMMHALGRVFNPKLTSERHLVHSPEDIADAFVSEPRNFLDLVHANYAPHFRDIESMLLATDSLSLSDVMLHEYRDDGLALVALNVGIRSVMVANESPVSGWMPVRATKRQPTAKRDTGSAIMSARLYATDFSTFTKLIEQKRPPALITPAT